MSLLQRALFGLGVAAALIVTMPAALYRGDARTMRMGTAHFLEQHSFGIPYARRAEVPRSFLEPRGQDFFENDAQQRLYSKYGVVSSLLYVPPLLVEQVLHGPLGVNPHSPHTLLYLNLYNVVWAVALALYWLELGSLFCRRTWLVMGYTGLVLFGTAVWYYLRAQAPELFQLTLLTAFAAHWMRWLRRSPQRSAQLDLVLALAAMAILSWIKATWGLLFPVVWLAVVLGADRQERVRTALVEALRFGAVALGVLVIMLAEHQHTFGSWLDFGYEQWVENGVAHDHFDVRSIPSALSDFLFQPDRALALHFFPWLVALFTLPGFLRRRPREGWFIVVSMIAYTFILCAHVPHLGGWCYGPRYFLPLLPLWSLPCLAWLDGLAERWQKGKVQLQAVAFGAAALGSFVSQLGANHLEFHAQYQVRDRLERLLGRSDAYFKRPMALINLDLLALREHGTPLPPMAEWSRELPAREAALLTRSVERLAQDAGLQTNYFWWRAELGLAHSPTSSRP